MGPQLRVRTRRSSADLTDRRGPAPEVAACREEQRLAPTQPPEGAPGGAWRFIALYSAFPLYNSARPTTLYL